MSTWNRSLRAASAVALAAVTLLLVTASAGALTVSPFGGFNFGATSNTTIRFTSTGQTIACTAQSIAFTVNSSGIGSSSAGSSSFAGCTSALLGGATITQESAWTVNVVLSAGPLVGLQVSIPAGGLRVRATSGTCAFTLNGTITYGRAYSMLSATVLTTDVFAVLSSSLTVDSVSSGCSPLMAVLNLAATFGGSKVFDRSFVVSG